MVAVSCIVRSLFAEFKNVINSRLHEFVATVWRGCVLIGHVELEPSAATPTRQSLVQLLTSGNSCHIVMRIVVKENGTGDCFDTAHSSVVLWCKQ